MTKTSRHVQSQAYGPYLKLVSLYENQLANLTWKSCQEYSLDEFRALLGVPPSRYKTFGELNKHILKPAVQEVNAIAPFDLSVLPVKQGKRVARIKVGWWLKDSEALQGANAELRRSKVGRRARLAGTVEQVAKPMPSANRLARRSLLDALPAPPRKPHSWRWEVIHSRPFRFPENSS